MGTLYSTLVEPNWLQIETLHLPFPNLPSAFEGFKVVQFSDTHFGPFFDGADAKQVVQAMEALEPDLIVFTGDLVTRLDHGEATLARDMLLDLQAPCGVFAILGNHDHWTDPEEVAGALRDGGATLLRNANRPIIRDDGRFWLAGVDDVWEGRQDLPTALEGTADGEPIVLLAHEPDYADAVAADGRVALQLSGHSHGGQVRLPVYGAPILPYLGEKYPIGLRRVGDLYLYTNRGVGLLAPPVRLNCRPEITEIVLQSLHSPAPPEIGEMGSAGARREG